MIAVFSPRYKDNIRIMLAKEFEGKVDSSGELIQVIEDRRLTNTINDNRKKYQARMIDRRRIDRRQHIFEFSGAIINDSEKFQQTSKYRLE